MAKKAFDTAVVLQETAEKLRELQESVELHGDGEHQSTIGDACRIAQALTATCAELRQHDKARAKALETYPVEEILEHLKQRLRDDAREDFALRLSGKDAEVGLL